MKGRICDLFNGLEIGMCVRVETGGSFMSSKVSGPIVSKIEHPYHFITIKDNNTGAKYDFTSSNTNQIEVL